MTITRNSFLKIAAVAVGLVMVFSFAAPVKAATAEELTAQINSLLATIASLQSQIGSVSGGSTSTACTFTRDLTIGAQGADVTCLQNFLKAKGVFTYSGTLGYFGSITQTAVKAWQAANGISPAAGYFGSISRAKYTATAGSTGTVTPVPTGTGLAVAAGSQPTNSLSPQGATRVPFTRFTLTAGSDGDVVVNSVTVQRTGLGSDAAFAGVILVDESTGKQLGIAKTFNSNHQATVGEAVTIPRGTTRTFLLAGNMASSLTSYAGEAPSISLVAVNTSATVSGSLPIVGANNTNNATLSVGSLSLDTSSANAANTSVSKEIGSTGTRVSGFRLTAGSSEDVRLRSLRFNQTGSVSSGDLANVMVNVGGTAYPMSVSADGKYYEANLGSGIVIAKGNNVEAYVSFDIIGSNSSGRTVIFDVDKTTDIYATGETYGYGISPTTAGGSSVPTSRGSTTETTGTPYVYANQITVTGASVTTITKNTAVAAQNIAINVPNQPLGGFTTDLKGESMTVQSLVFSVATTSGALQLTNVTLVDENGSVVAGPVDSAYVGSGSSTLTFTDSVTFKTGKHSYTLRGKVLTGSTNGSTYIVSSTPSSQWTNVKGDTTGNTISLSAIGSFSMNTMTVKSGALSVGRASSPASQTVVSGGTSVLMANFQFDATQSGEDVRLSSVPVQLDVDGGTNNLEGDPDFLTSCQLFDGATALNSGSNVLNPTATATSSDDTDTITLDAPVTVTKGTVKTLGMRCNISASVPNNSEYLWDVQAASTFTITGATSGGTITGTDASDSAVVVTVGTGATTVATDAASPGYMIAAAGSTGTIVGAYKFSTTNESLVLNKLGLTLSNSASSSAGDLVRATIWDGATQVGEAYFVGSATTATSTLSSPVTVTKNTDKTLTIKADFASVGTGESVTFSGHLVAINYLNAEGVGVDSGTTQLLGAAAGSTSVSGARVMKSFPVIAVDTLPSTGIADGRLMRFKVTADSKGPVSITNFGINISTTTASVTNVTIYGFTDANYSLPISGVTASGDLQATDDCTAGCTSAPNLAIGVTNSSGTATTIQVPAGGTRYFEVRGSVSGATSGASITTKLLGNSSFPSTSAGVSANPLLAAGSGSFTATTDMIWSPNSTTTVDRNSQDWTNGYGVNGLPSGGLISTRSQ